jgi:hypothetical protein
MARSHIAGARRVRVSYDPKGFGLALVVDNDRDDGAAEQPPATGEQGLLRVGEACVTLEIARPDGRPSVLSWDPAEVGWDPVVA